MSRSLVTNFRDRTLYLDHGSWRSLVLADDGNNFTGAMCLRPDRDGRHMIYLGPLAPSDNQAENHYKTVAPSFPCVVAQKSIKPIVHSNAGQNTGHMQIVRHVLAATGVRDEPDAYEAFCGFALRFEPETKIALAATSRSLNPGDNGQLETPLLQALFIYLSAELGKLPVNREVYQAAARTSPAAVALRNAQGNQQVVQSRMAMLSQMKTLGKK